MDHELHGEETPTNKASFEAIVDGNIRGKIKKDLKKKLRQ